MAKKLQATEESKNKPAQAEDTDFSKLNSHYTDADSELTTRITHAERGFDVYDRVYRNYINPAKWPFGARVPDGRGSALLKRKTDRILASKLQGVLVPLKNGTEMGARIGTELLLNQWNEVDIHSDEPMLMRWRRMDQNCRKYGGGFGLATWRTVKDVDGNVIFNGPWFEVFNNRDVLLQPGARSIEESEWVQLRRYPTISEMERINDLATTGSIYNKETLEALKKSLGGGASDNYTSVNKSVIGLSNEGAKSERLEVVTEYNRNTNKWKTFLPKNGDEKKRMLRTIENPYDHGDIPLVTLVYDKIDDDIYGVPELESALPLIKTSWALLSQYLEAAQSELYTPLMVNPLKVQLDTLEFKAGARWLMERPDQDVKAFRGGSVGMQKFAETFGLITSMIMEAVGETAQDVSNASQNFGDKTATEVRDMAMLRTARDNANKVILSSSIAKMMYFWLRMDQQFLDENKIVKIVGKDALKYFVEEGMHGWALSDEGLELVSNTAQEMEVSFEDAYNDLLAKGELEQYATPTVPSSVGSETMPKLDLSNDGKTGNLFVSKEDVPGAYHFMVDIEAMSMPNDQAEIAGRKMVFDATVQVKDDLASQGIRVKWQEMLEKIGESARLKDMEQYFEKMPEQPKAPTMPSEGMGGEGEIPPGAGGPQASGQLPPQLPAGGLPPIPAVA